MGRFISADSYASTGQGVLGYNMYAYCGNNPCNFYDPYGTTTWGLSLGGNITIGVGASINIGMFGDAKGNWEFQWSYVVPGIDNTATVGIIGAGIGATLQVTDRESIYDLYGPATSIGGSIGPGWYVGGDIISFTDASALNNDANGFQITAGVGVGVDFHVTESYTKPVFRQPVAEKSNSTQRGKHRPSHRNIELDRLTHR